MISVMEEISDLIVNNQIKAASLLAKEKCLFEYKKSNTRGKADSAKLEVFVRDGFIDRYSGEKLIFPGMLRLLSIILPEDFPFHSHWKMSETHIAYWKLFPTIDHVFPVARGGKDEPENLVTTTMLRNSIKAQWTLGEIQWQLYPRGDIQKWDGLMSVFTKIIDNKQDYLKNSYIENWYILARKHEEDVL